LHTFVAICLLAATSNGPFVHAVNLAEPPATQPRLVKTSKEAKADRLTLYNAKGERVAECDKKDGSFSNCKIEPGMTFDDVMNAWVHAYEDMETKETK
jgi:hypothetical protein